MMIRFLFLIALAAASLSAGEPAPLLPAEARWMIHLDVAALADGASGAWLDEIARRPELEAKLNAFALITGVRPVQDIASVTLYGTDDRAENGILALRGRFDAERLVALAKAAQDYRQEQVEELTVHSWLDAKQGHRVAASFVADDLLVFSRSLPQLAAAAAVLRDWPAPAGAADRPLLVLAAAEGIDRWQDLHPQAAMLRHLNAASLRLTERGDDLVLSLQLVTRDEDTAVHIGQIVQGLRALALLNEEHDVRLRRLVEALALQRDGSAVHVDLTVPLAELRAAVAAWEAQRRTGDAGEP